MNPIRWNSGVQPVQQKKGFKAALNVFLQEQVPQLGGDLTRYPIVNHICEMIGEYFPSTERMKMGQMLWYAVDEKEKAGYGKSLDKCQQRPVILDVLHDADIDDLLNGVKKRERQKKVIVRLFKEAYKQKGVLTHADVGSILRLAPGTVSRYVVEHEKETKEMVPRRGNIHDMGPTLTHKKIICTKHLFEGKTIEETARETNHSPAAVSRYVNDFMRVRECLKEKWDLNKIAFATGLSKQLTEQYVDMMNTDELPF
jgi:predicted transcriptional regulator